MSSIIMATSQPAAWREFLRTLEDESGMPIAVVATANEIIQAAHGKDLKAVILARDLQGMTAAELVQRLITTNAMVHVAWASAQTEEQFHQATEGLGILMKLSPTPDVSEARCLAERLSKMSGAI